MLHRGEEVNVLAVNWLQMVRKADIRGGKQLGQKGGRWFSYGVMSNQGPLDTILDNEYKKFEVKQ